MNIELITRDGCPACVKTKNLLKKKNLPFSEFRIGVDLTRDQVIERFPDQKMIPIILVDGDLVTYEKFQETLECTK